MHVWASDIHAAARQEPTGGPVFILYNKEGGREGGREVGREGRRGEGGSCYCTVVYKQVLGTAQGL